MEHYEIALAAIRAAAVFMIVVGLVPVAARLDCMFGTGAARLGRRSGIVQMFADAMKLASKSSGAAGGQQALLSICATAALVASLAICAGIPFSPPLTIDGAGFQVVVADLRAGLLFALAMISLWTMLAFASRLRAFDKRSFIGALGINSTYFSYFLAMCFALGSVVMVSGTVDVVEMAAGQGPLPWMWNAVRQPVAFAIFMASIVAASRASAGYPPEFSIEDRGYDAAGQAAAGAALVAVSEKIFVVAGSALASAVFLGGWQIPFASPEAVADLLAGWLPAPLAGLAALALGLICMLVKTCAVIAALAWARAGIPRLRADQFSAIGWKALLPLAVANLVATAYILFVISG